MLIRHMRSFALTALTLAAACTPRASSAPAPASWSPAIPARVPAAFPAEWTRALPETAAFAPHGMVSSDERLATLAGVEILRRGGNAVDAAVAVGFALAVTYQEAGNLGGGGFMVVRLHDGQVAAIDYREMAPSAATRNMYLDAAGNRTDLSLDGPLASGVPGSVAGLTTVLARFGSMRLADVMAPAIRLAEQGFIVDSAFRASIQAESARIAKFPIASARFLPGGSLPPLGSRFVQADLARTLRLIARNGAPAFYRGDIADSIVAEMQRGGGIITKADLASYKPVWRDPIRATYRGYTLYSMPPASSGGTTIAETLNLLETYPSIPPFGSAGYIHLLASAYQRAFIDRNSKLADPAFVNVPVTELTSKAYAQRLRATMQDRATPTPALERALGASVSTGGMEGTETTHYSVVDQWGNAVATTTTTNGLYGSGVLVRGAGFFMNNEMDDLAVRPGQPNQFGLIEGEQNAVAPGKRPLSAMSPSIVLDSAGRVLLVVGSRGGPRIITSTSQVILNVIEHRMSLVDAMRAPRIHHQSRPDSIMVEPDGFSPAVLNALRALGHGVEEVDHIGLVNAIMRVPGGWQGMSDPRRPAGAAGH